jgi:hypothetical protein
VSYRRHTVRFGIGLLWLTPVVVLTPFILEMPVYAAICAPFVVLSIRTMRIGVFTSDAGVTVRGVLRTWKLRWDEIAAFEWGARRSRRPPARCAQRRARRSTGKSK